jgi:2-methylcitrate dehydratase
MGITNELAHRIVSVDYASLPEDVARYSHSLALSALGAMVAGSARVSGRIMSDFVRRSGGNPQAQVLGTDLRTSVETAAMANATFAHSTEYEDDSFPEAVSTYTLFPVAYALAEHLRRSGSELLEAFVVGYETQARIALAAPEIRRRGMLTLSVAGSLGAAATAAKLLRLDVHQTTMALSLAASQCSGIAHQTGTTAHTFEMGAAARNGLTAGLLAAAGATGQPDVLEAPRGLLHALNGGLVPSSEEVFASWGSPWRLLSVGIKMYPCCYHLQRIIEALQLLKRQHEIDPRQVQSVQVEVNLFIPQVIQYPEPHDEDEAQFSMQHAVAAALLDRRVSPRSFSLEKLADPQFKDLRARVQMVVRKEWGWATIGWTPVITVTMVDGRRFTAQPERASGQPPNLLTFEQVAEKFSVCMDGHASPQAEKEACAMVKGLAGLDDVSRLVSVLAA